MKSFNLSKKKKKFTYLGALWDQISTNQNWIFHKINQELQLSFRKKEKKKIPPTMIKYDLYYIPRSWVL